MLLSHFETVLLVNLILKMPIEEARKELHTLLSTTKYSEPSFYKSIAYHKSTLNLTSDQWLELLSRLPNRVLWSQLELDKILSEEQRQKLPPVSG